MKRGTKKKESKIDELNKFFKENQDLVRVTEQQYILLMEMCYA